MKRFVFFIYLTAFAFVFLFSRCGDDSKGTGLIESDSTRMEIGDMPSSSSGATGTRHALLVGVSKYKDSAWCTISAHNDIELLQKWLNYWGFDVDVLEDDAATCSGIKGAMCQLIDSVSSGDTVVIHFSCHGQQVYSRESVNTEPDGLDEAFVPYDACMKKTQAYNGQNHLLDDSLNCYVAKLSDILGEEGLVLIFADACHSGGGEKGDVSARHDSIVVRGVDDIFGGDSISEKEKSDLRKKYDVQDTARIDYGKSKIVYVGACRSCERNRETKVKSVGYGSLSYAVCYALSCDDIVKDSLFFDCVYKRMTCNVPYQTPIIKTNFGLKYLLERENSVSKNGDKATCEQKLKIFLWASCGGLLFLLILMFVIWKRKR